MFIQIEELPAWAKIELTKEALLAFADRLRKDAPSLPTKEKESEVLTVDEAAEFLNLARQTLYGLTSKRAVPFYKKNKRLYFKKTELMAWVEEGKKKMQREFDDEIVTYLNRNKHKK